MGLPRALPFILHRLRGRWPAKRVGGGNADALQRTGLILSEVEG